MDRPAFILAGSHTAKAIDDLTAAIAACDDAEIGSAFQRIMAVTPLVLADPRECDRYEAIVAYVDALLESHYSRAA